jgi:8-oxo-dGTP pyrophosphatase MutT (NUDIX family)
MPTLFDAYPDLSTSISQLCGGATWGVTGASALLLDPRGDLLFEIAKPKHWRTDAAGRTVVGLGAFGGSLERGESILACLLREVCEELGSTVHLRPAGGEAPLHPTYLVYEERQIEAVPLAPNAMPRPALFTVSANLHRRQELDAEVLTIATFWAELATPPRIEDIYGWLSVPRGALGLLLAADSLPVGQALSVPGVTLGLRKPLPAGVWIEPIWTVRSLQVLWRAGSLVWADGTAV